jgi:hypothetical protein
MGDTKTLVVAIIISVSLGSLVSYQFAVSKSADQLSHLESDLRVKELEFAKLSSQSESAVPHGDTQDINCLVCHDLSLTKRFHIPQTIMKIDAARGKRRRICIDCHGPNAYDEQGNYVGWSAEQQMTPLGLISFNESAGPNGVFEFQSIIPHSIHSRLMNTLKVMGCEDCHLLTAEIEIPIADIDNGQVLVCQNCKYHPEEGNYIKIHVEDGGKGCPTCHLGNVLGVHKEKTLQLGKIN